MRRAMHPPRAALPRLGRALDQPPLLVARGCGASRLRQLLVAELGASGTAQQDCK